MGIFGTGWLLAWQIVAIVASLPMVWLMVLVQSAESIRPTNQPLSLGTFGVVMSAATYFIVAGLVSGTWAARRAGWPWSTAVLAGVAAATVLGLASWTAVYRMAAIGGKAWVWGTIVALGAMIVCVVGGPRWAG